MHSKRLPQFTMIIPKSKDVFVKHCAPDNNKVRKGTLVQRPQSRSQGHDIGFIRKDIISGLCMLNMKSLYLTVHKL